MQMATQSMPVTQQRNTLATNKASGTHTYTVVTETGEEETHTITIDQRVRHIKHTIHQQLPHKIREKLTSCAFDQPAVDITIIVDGIQGTPVGPDNFHCSMRLLWLYAENRGVCKVQLSNPYLNTRNTGETWRDMLREEHVTKHDKNDGWMLINFDNSGFTPVGPNPSVAVLVTPSYFIDTVVPCTHGHTHTRTHTRTHTHRRTAYNT